MAAILQYLSLKMSIIQVQVHVGPSNIDGEGARMGFNVPGQ